MVTDLEQLLWYVNIHNQVQSYGHPKKLKKEQTTLVHSNTKIGYLNIRRVTKWIKINLCCGRQKKCCLFSNKHNGLACIKTVII
jgi:hypothetical protein